MSRTIKQCAHTNKVQVGNPGIIEVFCADCNKLVEVKLVDPKTFTIKLGKSIPVPDFAKRIGKI
jgi:hypothetical protein